MKIVRRIRILKDILSGFDYSRNLTLDELGHTVQQGNHYAPSPEDDVPRIFQQLTILPTDAILDLGAGKGAAMVAMLKYPFQFVDGVELSEVLCEISRKNLSKLKVSNSRIFCSDAALFTDLDRYTYFYLFNPFPGSVLKKVLDNIVDSIGRNARKVTIIYYNPAFYDTIEPMPQFRRVKTLNTRYFQTFIYESTISIPQASS